MSRQVNPFLLVGKYSKPVIKVKWINHRLVCIVFKNLKKLIESQRFDHIRKPFFKYFATEIVIYTLIKGAKHCREVSYPVKL